VAGVTDRSGWCPIDPVTFESKLQPNVHIVGDAAIAGAMPKSAFAANSQAEVCAAAVARLVTGGAPPAPQLINTRYSLGQPARARLRDLGGRCLPALERPARRRSRRRRRQPV